MIQKNTIRKSILALTIGAVLAPGLATADGEEVAALRDRVNQLESMVRMLLDERDTTRSEMRRIEAATDEKVEQRVSAAIAELEPGENGSGESHSYKFGGYVKSDFMLSNYSDGDLAAGSLGRDFYVPGTVPVGGRDEGTDADFHARESRFHLRSDHVLASGARIGTYIELDFLVTAGGNERVSNSYTPRMRHAFIRTDNWLVGQTWSTFQNVGALAENLDFVGPSEGTVFERQAMVRYSSGPWQFAIENPETTVTPFGGGGRIVTDDGAAPDFVARYEHKGDWGNLVAAGIVRQLHFEDRALGIDDSETGLGLSLSGKVLLGKDDFRWMFSAGKGLGRYLGLNTANGVVIDAGNGLEAIDSMAGFVSYRHFWSPEWRSNFTLSYFDADNDTSLTGTGVTDTVGSFHANLIYSPLPSFDFGIEYLHANRELESGADGKLDRLQFSAKYSF